MIAAHRSSSLFHCMSRKISGLHKLKSIAEDEPVAGCVGEVSFRTHKLCLVRMSSTIFPWRSNFVPPQRVLCELKSPVVSTEEGS